MLYEVITMFCEQVGPPLDAAFDVIPQLLHCPLLELADAFLADAQALAQFLQCIAFLAQAAAADDRLFRITSYNVCYTKLLRAKR